ncbi:hypothetical protein BCV00_02025 [Vibrio breoganii]|nr:hypothetical protein BCV00_02025 [Vibrio breoganii]
MLMSSRLKAQTKTAVILNLIQDLSAHIANFDTQPMMSSQSADPEKYSSMMTNQKAFKQA